MTLHIVVQTTGRVPRFLTHPGLLKFSPIANFLIRMGGVLACQENAARVLENDGLLGIFPEGVNGAFTRYRDAYRLHSFSRDNFVKIALRHRAPIIPFVTVGSAEVHPVFAQIKSRRWTRFADWPCIPVSTFPLIPFPLPTKWHTIFLAPIHVEQQYPPEAAHDAAIVKAISLDVRGKMQAALDDIIHRRRSMFYGNVFAADDRRR
jgi:1-acyl-sn-glycerol-3-phosphate acyltransferase